ncbi:hypothetical protein GCM10011575_07040 [Microlunatus endophyticus]|uniref:DUF3071 domain-containing protein n=2 Tax=Microlunatus endophyticus TaxID=1716077 RepID=A0A917S1S1_9ACTN|nr:hypothetical protein GCM10011575_07040 [Microlunatus endophyticus]
MEQSMTPREIQMKIRAGASVEEIVESSGMPVERVEAFAAPVIAERNHIAGLAQTGSVRRTGEPSGHRTLRAAVNERLKERGVDPDTVTWDAFKMDDGRWSVSAAYRLEQADRDAVFYFDQRGRFSVAGNDDARWAIGEQSEDARRTSVRERAEEFDSEPTLKLAGPADELALVRAIETNEPTPEPEPAREPERSPEPEPQPEARSDPEPDDETHSKAEAEPETEFEAVVEVVDYQAVVADDGDPEASSAIPDQSSQLDLLYELLGNDGFAEDSIRVFEGLSDAVAVPDVADSGWQPPEDEAETPDGTEIADQTEGRADEAEPADSVADPEPTVPVIKPGEPVQPDIFADGATQETLPGADPEPDGEPELKVEPEPEVATETEPSPEPPAEKPAAKSKKRKRAAVPSWDEIMFGSPGPKGK